MAEQYFHISTDRGVSILSLTVPVEVDPMLIDRLIEQVIATIDQSEGGRWLLDLSAVSYLNSAGLGLLVNVREKVRQKKGKLVLSGLSPMLMGIFKSCCLEKLFTITKTKDEGVTKVLAA
jgi:anti-sigma B factor antagonist